MLPFAATVVARLVKHEKVASLDLSLNLLTKDLHRVLQK